MPRATKTNKGPMTGKKGSTKTRATSSKLTPEIPNPTHRSSQNELRTQTNRPVKSGGGVHRGDRRDMNKAYTGNVKHSARGNTPRANVSTRKS